MVNNQETAQPQPSPAQPQPASQPFRASKIAVPKFNSFQKRVVLLVRNGVPGPVPDHAERPQTTDSGTLLDQFNRGASSKAILRRL